MKILDSIQSNEKCILEYNTYLFCGNYTSLKFLENKKTGKIRIYQENRNQEIWDNENMNDKNSRLVKREFIKV